MAPEVMRCERYDTPADVWSFGVMLGELVTCKTPYLFAGLTPAQVSAARCCLPGPPIPQPRAAASSRPARIPL
jgi:serine/threonine protein kinase